LIICGNKHCGRERKKEKRMPKGGSGRTTAVNSAFLLRLRRKRDGWRRRNEVMMKLWKEASIYGS
jgi:hypothetical protein